SSCGRRYSASGALAIWPATLSSRLDDVAGGYAWDVAAGAGAGSGRGTFAAVGHRRDWWLSSGALALARGDANCLFVDAADCSINFSLSAPGEKDSTALKVDGFTA